VVPAALTPLGLGARTLVMGVLNATDDSFSGDGLGGDARRLAARGLEMVLAGAALNLSPETLGGTSMRLSLIVDDPDAVAERAIAAGATEVFPIADQPYGLRQGRVADPYGHHWLIGRPLADAARWSGTVRAR